MVSSNISGVFANLPNIDRSKLLKEIEEFKFNYGYADYPTISQLLNLIPAQEDVYKINVNATWMDWNKQEISYEDIVRLGDKPYREDYSMTYSQVRTQNGIKGTLHPGDKINLCNNLIFNFGITGNA